jgi:hypothetical protein
VERQWRLLGAFINIESTNTGPYKQDISDNTQAKRCTAAHLLAAGKNYQEMRQRLNAASFHDGNTIMNFAQAALELNESGRPAFARRA